MMIKAKPFVKRDLCEHGQYHCSILKQSFFQGTLNFVQTLSTRFGQEFEVEVQAKLLKLKFGQYFAAEAW